ncbi:uncharacterized protein LOC113075363, partial [Carassius auratus]|uniref:Uncharacterized protein LOC113075363 n=1 Tax=Carassius auratus TaxID=7957 RepID=A0A6P6N677_CARAU
MTGHGGPLLPDSAVRGHGDSPQDHYVRNHPAGGGQLLGADGSRQAGGGGVQRRLILSEAKLRERERFKRLEVQSQGSTNHEKPSAAPETKQNVDQVCEPKPGGEVKEEATEARNPQACQVIHPQIHKQKDPPGSVEETNGLRMTDSDHKPGGRSGTDIPVDEARHRNLKKWFDPKKDPLAWSPVSQPEPARTSVSSESPGLRPQIGSIDSGPVKEEVVVMLPPDWEDIERIRPQVVSAQTSAKKAQLDLQPGDPLITGLKDRSGFPILRLPS